MADKRDELSATSNRDRLEKAALTLVSAKATRFDRLDALGTLLSAYSLGSRTAARGLQEYQARFPGWRLPPRDQAMALAHEAFREAEALKAAQRAGDTLPGY